MKRIRLGVNIDHVATLRQARGTVYPDPVQAAFIAEANGADGITLHLREDRRHIQERDLDMLLQTAITPLNLECAVTDEMLAIACTSKPAHCCLVPERREELTTEGGLNVAGQSQRVGAACRQLAEAGIRVSLFIDPDPKQIEAALAAGTAAVELHTGRYADAETVKARTEELDRIIQAAAQAKALGLEVHAGHGLTRHNVSDIAAIPQIEELNIGHALIAEAVFMGLGPAVAEMKALMQQARSAA